MKKDLPSLTTAPQLTHPPPPPSSRPRSVHIPTGEKTRWRVAGHAVSAERTTHAPHSGPVCLAACGGPRPTPCDGTRRRAERKAAQREDGERTRAAEHHWLAKERERGGGAWIYHTSPSTPFWKKPGPVGQVMQCHLLSRSRRTPPSQPRPLPYIHHLRGMGLTKRGTHVERPMLPTLPPSHHPLCTRRPLPRAWGAAAAAAFSCACLAVDLSPPPPRSRVPREWKKMEESMDYRSCRYRPWGGRGGGGSKAAGISVEKRTRACNLYLSVDGGGHATMLWSAVSKQDSKWPSSFQML